MYVPEVIRSMGPELEQALMLGINDEVKSIVPVDGMLVVDVVSSVAFDSARGSRVLLLLLSRKPEEILGNSSHLVQEFR